MTAAAWFPRISRSRSNGMPPRKLPDDDLLDIRTLGFRRRGAGRRSARWHGSPSLRAMPASRTRGRFTVDGGVKSEVKPAAPRRRATRVEVRDLFYAHAGTAEVSSRAIAAKAEAIRGRGAPALAMSRPDVAFTLGGRRERTAGDLGGGVCRARPAAWPGSAIFSGPSSAPMPSRCMAGREGLAIEGFAAAADADAREPRWDNICSSTGVRWRDKAADRRGARRLRRPTCRATAIRSWPCSSRSMRAEVGRQRASGQGGGCAFRATPGLVRSLLIRALQDALRRREGQAARLRPAGSATIRRVPACDDAAAPRRLGTGASRRRGRSIPRGFFHAGVWRRQSRPSPKRRRPLSTWERPRLMARLRDRRAIAPICSTGPLGAARPRAGARDLYRGADPRRARHRRSACGARAHRLRAYQGRRWTGTAFARPDPTDPRDRRARRGRCGARGSPRARPSSCATALAVEPFGPGRGWRWRETPSLLGEIDAQAAGSAISASTWPNGTRPLPPRTSA